MRSCSTATYNKTILLLDNNRLCFSRTKKGAMHFIINLWQHGIYICVNNAKSKIYYTKLFFCYTPPASKNVDHNAALGMQSPYLKVTNL